MCTGTRPACWRGSGCCSSPGACRRSPGEGHMGRCPRGEVPVVAPIRILRTRLLKPRLPPGCPPRARLVRSVANALGGPLVGMTAGAGYGTTTLLVQALDAAGLPAVWCSCDNRRFAINWRRRPNCPRVSSARSRMVARAGRRPGGGPPSARGRRLGGGGRRARTGGRAAGPLGARGGARGASRSDSGPAAGRASDGPDRAGAIRRDFAYFARGSRALSSWMITSGRRSAWCSSSRR